METLSASLALCAGNSPVTGEFPSQRPVPRSFDALFDLRLDKWLSEQSRRRWFRTPSRSLWCHCNERDDNVAIASKWLLKVDTSIELLSYCLSDETLKIENCYDDQLCRFWWHRRLLLWRPTVLILMIKMALLPLSVFIEYCLWLSVAVRHRHYGKFPWHQRTIYRPGTEPKQKYYPCKFMSCATWRQRVCNIMNSMKKFKI